jgi:hypothetical protein
VNGISRKEYSASLQRTAALKERQMRESEFGVALEKLRMCMVTRNGDEITDVLMELETITLEVEAWPAGFVDGLQGLLKDQNFRSLTNSWNLLYFISGNWEQLSEQARDGLRVILAESFDTYGTFMGPFVTAEILGEHYADSTTLTILAHLAKSARLPARVLIPHALETLANTTQDELLRGRAIRQLQELKESDSEEVRDEASLSLAKLGQKTI